MDTFLFRYPQAIEEVFNFGIVTNDQELDSVDLQIIFDFEFFFKEGFQNYPHDAYENLDFVENSYKELDLIDEMAAHAKIVDSNRQYLLKHPLAEAYLHLKWQLVQKYFYFNMFLYACFVITLTAFAILQTEMLKCKRGLINEIIVCGDFNKLSYNHSHQFNFLTIVGEHLKTNEDNHKAWLFVILGIGSVIGLCFIAIRLAHLKIFKCLKISGFARNLFLFFHNSFTQKSTIKTIS